MALMVPNLATGIALLSQAAQAGFKLHRQTRLIPVNAVQTPEALAHRLFQIVTRLAEAGIASCDEFVLFALQIADVATVTGFLKHPDVRPVDLPIEVGEFGIGANRLLDRPPCGGAPYCWKTGGGARR
jgi:hypothetical protein